MRLNTFEADGAILAVREWGDPDAPPILFWHSLGPFMSGQSLCEAAPGLSEAYGFRVIAPDAPGFGRSPALPPDRYAADELARIELALLDRLGIERAVLMGHSWGGAVSCVAAASAPERVRALVLLDSGHVDYADWPGADLSATLDELIADGEEARLRVADWDELEAMLREALRRWSPALREAVREGVREKDGRLVGIVGGEARGPAMYELLRARVSATWPVLEEHGVPALLLLATEPEELKRNNETAVGRFSAKYPSATVVPVADCGHGVTVDLGADLATIVGDWLREQLG